MMKWFLFCFYFSFALLAGCGKSESDSGYCGFANDPTIGSVHNRAATISKTSDFFYIRLTGSDTTLGPCNLPDEYKVPDLPITVTGDLKPTNHVAYLGSNHFNFVITAVSK